MNLNYIKRIIASAALALCLTGASAHAAATTPPLQKAKPAATAVAEAAKGKVLRSRIETAGRALLKFEKPSASLPKAFRSSPLKAQGGEDATLIYGSLDWSDNWSTDDDDYYVAYGIYTLPINGSDGVKVKRRNDKLHANGGGVYKDGKYYFIICYNSLWGNKFPYLSVADTENWNLVVDEMSIPSGAMATDMTYDAVTDKAYGCFHTSDDITEYFFGAMDLNTAEVSMIVPLDDILVAVAADNAGRVFGIDTHGNLSEFDKTTGEARFIGQTGVASDYQGSACFDPATDRLYWNVSVDTPSGEALSSLYEVNTTDASLRLVCNPKLNEQFTGLFIFPPKANAEAPASVKNLAIVAADNALEGKVTFTMPAETYTGNQLQGELGYSVTLNGSNLKQGKAQAGAQVEVPFTLDASAVCTVEVTVSNASGDSPVEKAERWVGPDVPKAVGNLTATRSNDGKSISLSWTVDPKGEHDTAIDPSEITFDVVRYPGAVTVAKGISATSLTDTPDLSGAYTVYHYTVTPLRGANRGATAESNAVSVGSIIPPFFENFDTKFGFDVFNILDLGGDNTWTYRDRDGNGCASVRFDVIAPMNDWLITPPVHLEAERAYHFSFKASGEGGMWTEKVEAFFGNAPTAEAMTTELVRVTELPEAEYVTLSGTVIPTAEGDYYFGIHGRSSANQFNLNVDDISIVPGASLYGPAAPELSAKSDMTGALAVTLDITAPTLSLKGTPLDRIEKVELYRGTTLINTFNAPQPGTKLSFVDNSPESGLNTYSAKAYNHTGAGETATIQAQAGFDSPAAPRNVRITETAPGTVSLTWEAPEIGQHGGPIRPETLRYSIVRSTDQEIVASGVRELTFTDTPVTGSRQENVSYFVIGQTDEGLGTGVNSATIPVGEAYALPFDESFAGASLAYSTWLIRRPEGSAAQWGLAESTTAPAARPSDLDGGMGAFFPTAAGEEGTLLSGKISIEDATNPTLEFYYFYNPGNDCIAVDVETPDGNVTRAFTADFSTLTGTAEWRKASVSLAQFNGNSHLRIGFTARSGKGNACILIDEVYVADILDYDLAIASVSVAARPKPGTPTPVTVIVANNGQLAAEGYTVGIYTNGELRENLPGFSIEPGATATHIHAYTPSKGDPAQTVWEARVNFAADQNEANNSRTAMSFALTSSLPAVTDLEAETEAAAGVKLTWSKPQANMLQPVTDGVEDYENFAITGIGDWTMFDGDQSPTYSFMQNGGDVYDYPNVGMPMAFQVLDPSAIGLPASELAGARPRSGKQMFICFGATDTANDDWLISPQLSGESQVISFFARSLTSSYGLESFELYYSVKGTDHNDFIRIKDVNGSDVPLAWTEYAALLPEGARHFAIRCVSADRFALLVDDITFTRADAATTTLNPTGFNVYRDGEQLNATPLTETGYTDTAYDGKRHSYNVTAIYAEGESAGSNTVTVDLSGLDSITTGNGITVSVDRNEICISAATPVDVTVTATDGKTVFAGEGHSTYRVAVSPGIYLVKAANTVTKVIAR